jgi:tetratricopeptide (TPR) repeat protein
VNGERARALIGAVALLALAALASFSALAQASESWGLLSRQAAKAYAEGRYDEASRLYALLAQSGLDGAAVRYDLGNCHLKRGDLGRAILEYRRALKYDPDLAPAQQNLQIARRLLKARVSPWQPSPWEAAVQGLPEGALEWGILAFALLGNLALGAVLLLPTGNPRRACLMLMVGAFVTAGGGMALLAYADTVVAGQEPAVVVSVATVYPGPEAKDTPIATLPPGSEVIRVSKAGAWSLVLWGEGRGWTESASVEVP